MSKIEIKNLTKNYGKTQALDSVSLTVAKGNIYGLLGRNGAGKTTLLNIISGRDFANSGEVLLDGSPLNNDDKLLKKVYCMDADELIPLYMKVSEVFDGMKYFYKNFDRRYAEELLGRFEISAKKSLSKLSTGGRTIAKAVFALSSGADFILLDEPTLGLDPGHREILYQAVLERFEQTEAAFVISTHLVDECAGLFEKCFVIKSGRIVANEDCERLRRSAYTVTGRAADAQKYAEGKEVISQRALGSLMEICIRGEAANVPDSLDVSQPTLQQLLIAMTEEG